MKKKIVYLFLALTLAVSVAGCSKKTPNVPAEKQKTEDTKKEDAKEEDKEEKEVPDDGKFHGEYVVDTEYVKEHIDDENVLFVDARGWKTAALGTVKGAIATTWQDLCTCSEGKAGDENWGKIPEPSDLAARLGELGMTKDKEIILLGETATGWGDDARLLWELVAAGYENVKMVDGGMEKIKADGVETQLLVSKAEPGTVEIDQIDFTHVGTTEELLEDYDSFKVVDVRTDEEYDGAVLYDEAKGGHLPGAIHIRYTDMFQEDGTLKPNKELIQMFEDAGLSKDDKIITYCTGGIRSAYTQLVLEMCGFEDSLNYDQSYWRWCVVGDVE